MSSHPTIGDTGPGIEPGNSQIMMSNNHSTFDPFTLTSVFQTPAFWKVYTSKFFNRLLFTSATTYEGVSKSFRTCPEREL